MIEQYTITTTPKYNFPQPTTDTILPQRFLELSLHSLRQVHNQAFQVNQQTFQQLSSLEQNPANLQLKRTPIPLKPDYHETIIAAVDTSTIKIGETSQGIIIAIRGATIWKQNRNYRYTRLGPFIFHITEDNKKEVYNTLETAYFHTSYSSSHQVTPNLMQMPTRLSSLLERWLQAMLSRTVTNGLILFDGSLTSGTIDTPVQRMKEILNIARRNGNTVLAFSKMTNLRVNGYLITDLLPEQEPPYLLETTGLQFKPPTTLLGDVYVARLNKANYAFRLDIDREIPLQDRMRALEKLIGNDLYTQSYPETLRLAHILCTFTANEVLAMQHFITRKHGIQIVNRPDMHRLLFGPFGKGEGYA
ncbi:MAG: DNA double-strand break repair nuclease NurA [Candidatus Bathyarchaeota archaeon]|nr:DNA double-strand break repair nuclease NurA [Candidatus Bathyarchaeota archaeon]